MTQELIDKDKSNEGKMATLRGRDILLCQPTQPGALSQRVGGEPPMGSWKSRQHKGQAEVDRGSHRLKTIHVLNLELRVTPYEEAHRGEKTMKKMKASHLNHSHRRPQNGLQLQAHTGE